MEDSVSIRPHDAIHCFFQSSSSVCLLLGWAVGRECLVGESRFFRSNDERALLLNAQHLVIVCESCLGGNLGRLLFNQLWKRRDRPQVLHDKSHVLWNVCERSDVGGSTVLLHVDLAHFSWSVS